MARQYTFAEVAELSGAGRARLNHRSKKGIIRGFQSEAGSGRHQAYSFFNVLQAAIAANLGDLNATVAIISLIIDHFRLLEGFARASGTVRAKMLKLNAAKTVPRGIDLVEDELSAFKKELVSDFGAWTAFRDPFSRAQFTYFGVMYSHLTMDPVGEAKHFGSSAKGAKDSRMYGRPRLLVIPKGGNFLAHSFGRAAVLVNVGVLLQALEKATGDSLV